MEKEIKEHDNNLFFDQFYILKLEIGNYAIIFINNFRWVAKRKTTRRGTLRKKKIKRGKKWRWNRPKESNKGKKLNKEVAMYLILVQVLERSGILDAYEYFLRAICKNGLPEANIF